MTRMSSSINIPKKAKGSSRPAGWIGFTKRVTESKPMYQGGQPMGKFYGTGVRAKLGKLRDGTMLPGNPVKKSKLHTPPRSVV